MLFTMFSALTSQHSPFVVPACILLFLLSSLDYHVPDTATRAAAESTSQPSSGVATARVGVDPPPHRNSTPNRVSNDAVATPAIDEKLD